MTTIAVTNQKGGVGKSTLTFNLAQNLCKTSKVAILDMDLQGSMAQLSDIVSDFTITTDKSILEEPNKYDFIFIDTPPYLSKDLKYLIQISDLILIPSKAGVLDLMAVESTINLISGENKLNSAMVVFNMIKPNTTLTNDIKESLGSYKVKIAKTHISDLVSFTRSVLLNGVEENHKAQRQIDNLTKEILTSLL